MKVVWSDEAKRRLREIVDYIAQDSPSAAKKIAMTLLQRSQALGSPPLLGRRLPENIEGGCREILVRPYRLIYVMTTGGVEIVTVMHYRQMLPPYLLKN